MKKEKPAPFNQVIKALLDEEKPFPARLLYRLSDINDVDLPLLEQTWLKLSVRRRQAVMEDIQEFNEDDYLLDYFRVGLLAARDPDPIVRRLAVLTLTEYEEDNVIVPLFIRMAEGDQDVAVRAAAAAGLGGAVEQGELEELPASLLHQAEECLLRVSNGQDAKMVRLKALEALGYSSLEEVKPMIKAAYQSQDTEWMASALTAMGRSYDREWAGDVLAAISDSRPVVRQEAVTAAGELELEDCRPELFDLLKDKESGVRQAAIWALSQIGGNGVRDILEKMLETSTDDDEADLLDVALENLEFTEGFGDFDILSFDEDIENLLVDEEDDSDLAEDDQEK